MDSAYEVLTWLTRELKVRGFKVIAELKWGDCHLVEDEAGRQYELKVSEHWDDELDEEDWKLL